MIGVNAAMELPIYKVLGGIVLSVLVYFIPLHCVCVTIVIHLVDIAGGVTLNELLWSHVRNNQNKQWNMDSL